MAASDAVRLVQAVEGDAAAIRKLTREAYAKWVSVIGREPRPMTADYTEALKKHRFGILNVNRESRSHRDRPMRRPPSDRECRGVPGLSKKRLRVIAHAEKLASSSNFATVRLYTRYLSKTCGSTSGWDTAWVARKKSKVARWCT
jgi:hypothetical protein